MTGTQIQTPTGMTPPAFNQEVEMMHHLILLLLTMVIVTLKAKIIIKRK